VPGASFCWVRRSPSPEVAEEFRHADARIPKRHPDFRRARTTYVVDEWAEDVPRYSEGAFRELYEEMRLGSSVLTPEVSCSWYGRTPATRSFCVKVSL